MSVKVAKVERFARIDRNDEAYLAFDIDADLTSTFSWRGDGGATSSSPKPNFFQFFTTLLLSLYEVCKTHCATGTPASTTPLMFERVREHDILAVTTCEER